MKSLIIGLFIVFFTLFIGTLMLGAQLTSAHTSSLAAESFARQQQPALVATYNATSDTWTSPDYSPGFSQPSSLPNTSGSCGDCSTSTDVVGIYGLFARAIYGSIFK